MFHRPRLPMMEWNGTSIGTLFIDSRSGESGSRPLILFGRNAPLIPAAEVAARSVVLPMPVKTWPGSWMSQAPRIRFIKRAQALGFTLEDVAGLLQLNNTDACAKTYYPSPGLAYHPAFATRHGVRRQKSLWAITKPSNHMLFGHLLI
jgi:hypothetical protein